MGKIYLTRHGQDQDNANQILNGRRDTLLTELGLMQADDLAARVANLDIGVVCSSPLLRAKQTGDVVRRKLALPDDRLVVYPKLIERDFGILTGRPKSDIPKLGRNLIELEHTTFALEIDGAEPWPDALTRADEVLHTIEREHQDHNALIVCHGDIGNMIRAAFYKIDWLYAVRNYSRFMNCDVFELSHQVHGGRLI